MCVMISAGIPIIGILSSLSLSRRSIHLLTPMSRCNITTPFLFLTVMRFAEYLLQQYGNDPDVTWIVDCELHDTRLRRVYDELWSIIASSFTQCVCFFRFVCSSGSVRRIASLGEQTRKSTLSFKVSTTVLFLAGRCFSPNPTISHPSHPVRSNSQPRWS
jgi:hypothetical protein